MDGLRYGERELLFTAKQIQRVADQAGFAYDFTSRRDGEVSACRDPIPFSYRGEPHLLIAAKQVVNGQVKPAAGVLKFRDNKYVQVEVLAPLQLPEFNLHPSATIQYEVPNVVVANGRLFLQLSVSYQENGRFQRSVHTFTADSLAGEWQPINSQAGLVHGPASATYGVGMVKLANGKIGVQGFFNGYHQQYPVQPTEFKVVEAGELADLQFTQPANVLTSTD